MIGDSDLFLNSFDSWFLIHVDGFDEPVRNENIMINASSNIAKRSIYIKSLVYISKIFCAVAESALFSKSLNPDMKAYCDKNIA